MDCRVEHWADRRDLKVSAGPYVSRRAGSSLSGITEGGDVAGAEMVTCPLQLRLTSAKLGARHRIVKARKTGLVSGAPRIDAQSDHQARMLVADHPGGETEKHDHADL